VIDTAEIEARLQRFIEHHLQRGEHLPVAVLCDDRPDLASAVQALIDRYLSISHALTADPLSAATPPGATASDLPVLPGLQVIERLGSGGMGDVYKVRDPTLNRVVAAKVLRTSAASRGSRVSAALLQEARAMALFSDPRIVRIYDARTEADPPVILMELVEGFELLRVGRSLDRRQQARVLIEVCEGVQHAHDLGIQHRDLKPSNIMLDAQLRPRILDFGVSSGEPGQGHLVGTPPYMAPEQLDPSRPIDARADVHALGVILYELLAGAPPAGSHPRLPVEIDPTVPEPLQRIALVAMEADPARRYQTASEMARDLRRYLDGAPVTARPSIYGTTLASRVRPHLEEIGEWLALNLIHRHEGERLRTAYAALDAREDEWILESRTLSFTQISLYLGAFLLICGSLFYFVAARWYGTVDGITRPFLALAVPFAGLNAAAHLLYRRDHKAVAVAFYLAAVVLLPLFLLILFHEMGWLLAAPGTGSQLFENGAVSNRQLQVTILAACAWCGWLAVRTRTSALSTVFTVLTLLFALSVTADFGLRAAIEDGRWDRVAGLLFPVVGLCAALGYGSERTRWPWFSRPSYLGAAAIFILAMELLALDGRMLAHLGGFSLAPWQPSDVSSPRLLDTIAGMTVNGALFYAAASLLSRSGSAHAGPAAQFLYMVAPFALLHPLGFLVRTGEYSPRFDWLYAGCALGVMLLSERRQRRSFYYAGLLNLGIALFLVALHREWFDRPAWAVAVIVVGILTLGVGFLLDRRTRRDVK
jgi:predicted Ser/Thr protein kinase